ncbi:glycosyltransferase family 4 protein [Mucilaginibacter sabulilitoris]|uniref:Glycosyltransferase family 4 protein n=1 Tax=Mucilaginibacter sabulilitoris TaxID=1173583 RepID=A0ABZ0TRQ1_9SPHI|nr:glycosyltransferase family 4 protein [Mucilaginibacter sabulilitoris]WPU95805.1 glycosyltransferase family 4 protein [Mucilaginibacter sabulilitoris]
MNFLTLLIIFFVLFTIELGYFKLAFKYRIIDHPNHRSSHAKITIRGGGMIFSMALLLSPLYYNWEYGYFLLGLFLISLVSFIDDIKPVSHKIRILFHLTAAALLFYQTGIFHLPLYWAILGFIFVIGSINAVNFMDGINGITGSFGLVTLSTLYYINKSIVVFTAEYFLILPILGLLVFVFFNFRKKAKCFAGDVGSVSLGFIVLFFLIELILKTNNLNYLFLLLVYGLDTISTIIFRIIRKENIFEAHRNHFYQFLVNKKRVPHLVVAGSYTIAQGIVNLIVINILPLSIVNLSLVMVATMSAFILIRINMEGQYEILNVKT